MSTVVGVDVGGSGLRCVVLRDGVRGEVSSAPGIRIGSGGVSLPALVETVREVLPAGERIDALTFAARSFTTLADPAEVLAAVVGLGATRSVLCADAISSLVGALGGVRPGAVIAAGTGAIAFGTDFAGVHRRVDGWGHVLGDRGSAAWLGAESLRRLLVDVDLGLPTTTAGEGFQRPGALLVAAQEHFGPAMSWPRQVMTRDDAPALLGAFAPRVTSLVQVDPQAAALCAEAGGLLAATLLAAAAPLPADAVLSWTGGLLSSPAVHRPFEAAVVAAGRQLTPPVGGSLDGALLLANAVAAGELLQPFAPYLMLG